VQCVGNRHPSPIPHVARSILIHGSIPARRCLFENKRGDAFCVVASFGTSFVKIQLRPEIASIMGKHG
jgi:hypothetical protein